MPQRTKPEISTGHPTRTHQRASRYAGKEQEIDMATRGGKPDKARRALVVRMRDRGMSFAAIGRALVPPVSSQTAQYLYRKGQQPNSSVDTGK